MEVPNMPIDERMVKWDDAPKGIDERMVKWDDEKTQTSMAQDIKQGLGNVIAGGLRGAGSIGATLVTPIDLLMGNTKSIGNPERRQRMDDAFGSMGAETDSFGYGAGKLAGEIAGTAGLGGALVNGVRMGAAVAGKAVPVLFDPLLAAIGSGGMVANGAGMATRTAGGAINGLVTAGAVNPQDALMGGIVGGAMPGSIKMAGAVGRGIKAAGAGIAKNTLGMTTGAGAETFGTAYRAGKEGGTNFVDNMRGNVPMTDVLDEAKTALSKMRMDRSAEYKQGMVGIANDKTVINFAPIDAAVNSIKSMGSYKGQVINKNASGTVDEISGLVAQWKGLDPAEFHTPEGLDALKQAISDVRDTTQFGTAARKAADTAYNAVKGEIVSQAPTYAKVMKDYSAASETLKEVERALSLGNKAAADTSMRKLQSLMRNNVNTNYGNRLGLAKTLEQNGADILPAIAGQAASSWTPRGLQGLAATGAGLASLANPATLAALPLTSPRLMGELAYGLGAMNRGVANGASATGQRALGLLGSPQGGLLTMDRLAPLLATTSVLSANQR
jgi:hypothetical protein